VTPLADRQLVCVVGGFAQLAFSIELDREAVAVPAGQVAHVKTLERTVLDHDVLEHLVEHVSVVDPAVGIGRTVVKYKKRLVLGLGQQLLVNPVLFPELDEFGLSLGQGGPHRKLGPRQADGIFEVNHFQYPTKHAAATLGRGAGQHESWNIA
jgi:hypothetical protein